MTERSAHWSVPAVGRFVSRSRPPLRHFVPLHVGQPEAEPRQIDDMRTRRPYGLGARPGREHPVPGTAWSATAPWAQVRTGSNARAECACHASTVRDVADCRLLTAERVS